MAPHFLKYAEELPLGADWAHPNGAGEGPLCSRGVHFADEGEAAAYFEKNQKNGESARNDRVRNPAKIRMPKRPWQDLVAILPNVAGFFPDSAKISQELPLWGPILPWHLNSRHFSYI